MVPLYITLASLLLSSATVSASGVGGLHSLTVLAPGESPKPNPSPSSSSSPSSTSQLPSLSSPTLHSEPPAIHTEQPTKTDEDPWALTTVFTQPTDCLYGITQYAGSLSTLGYWLNIPFPAPGITLTSCFPPALVASVTASEDQPPYNQLVCPYNWESYDYNSTYRICCPSDFRLYAPGIISSNTIRPGLGAWCTSWAWPGTHAALTRYYTDGHSSVIDTRLGSSENWLVQATAFDGFIPGSGPHDASPTTHGPKAAITTAITSTTSSGFAMPTGTGPTALGMCLPVLANALWMAII